MKQQQSDAFSPLTKRKKEKPEQSPAVNKLKNF